MRRFSRFCVLLGAVAALLFVAACGLLVPKTPTEVAPPQAPATDTPPPTVPSIPAPPATSTLIPSPTATAPEIASPTPRLAPTSVPPTDTARPPSPLPPTSTLAPTPTQTRPAPTATHTPSPVPPLSITDWRGEYYANRSLTGPAALVRNDKDLDFSLAPGMAPATGLPSENWSARWTRTWRFKEGNYRFRLLVDDGARLWVGDRLLFDAWTDGPAREFTAERYLKGKVALQLDYYNGVGDARVRLTWEPVTEYANWLGSYYDNRELSGLPVFQRDDRAIRFDWGAGSPRADMPADHFSVRWSRRLTFGQAGPVLFHAESDDGIRLWVDGALVIDAWRDGQAVNEGLVNLTAGAHDLRLEYYERRGAAFVRLSWSYAQTTATPTGTPSATATGTPSATPSATPSSTPTVVPIVTLFPSPPRPIATTVRPPRTPLPGGPGITLHPDAGPVGAPFGVKGTGWPAGSAVSLYLLRGVLPEPQPGKGATGPIELATAMAPGGASPQPVAQVAADQAGRFEVQLIVPPGEGWEGLPAVIVLAQTPGGQHWAQASYRLVPGLSSATPLPAMGSPEAPPAPGEGEAAQAAPMAAAADRAAAVPEASAAPTLVAAAPLEKAAPEPEAPLSGGSNRAWLAAGVGALLLLGWGVGLGVNRRMNRRR